MTRYGYGGANLKDAIPGLRKLVEARRAQTAEECLLVSLDGSEVLIRTHSMICLIPVRELLRLAYC